MSEQTPISLFVKLKYWDAYRLYVLLMASVFRKVLYFWAFFALLWLALSVISAIHPAHGQDWAVIMQNASPLQWVFGLPIFVVFILPLLPARRMTTTAKRGVNYRFSQIGIHLENSVSSTDFSWAAISRVWEIRTAFLVFTNPHVPFMVPKSCLQSASEVDSLRELFHANVANSKLRHD